MQIVPSILRIGLSLAVIFLSPASIANEAQPATDRTPINALYIPLADHYAAIVAFERYREEMRYADFQLIQMKSWDLLRAYFRSGKADMAYVMGPLAMDMYSKNPDFRWIGLMHRDGNALAINELMNQSVQLPLQRKDRKPDSKVALAFNAAFQQSGKPTEVAVPHLLSTHTVVLYRYLKEQEKKISLHTHGSRHDDSETVVIAIAVPPQKSPLFIKSKSNRALPAAFEQSLPWADVVETSGFGQVAWYSKDVMPWNKGHVECIAIATNRAIENKQQAVAEVMHFIRRAGNDIEQAREQGSEALGEIVTMVRKHIPAHTQNAIVASLDPKLRVINYQHLEVDKAGLKLIMEYAVEGGILTSPIDIDSFADQQFDQWQTENLQLN